MTKYVFKHLNDIKFYVIKCLEFDKTTEQNVQSILQTCSNIEKQLDNRATILRISKLC